MSTLTKKKVYSHTPDYISVFSPGDTLCEKIFEMGIGADELAKRCGIPLEIINLLLEGNASLTQDIAEKLEKVTWIKSEIWLRMEANYRAKLEKVQDESKYSFDWENRIAIPK